MALIFSGTQPLITLFAALYFTLKYYIDKYNLTFVYNREFEGGGVIKKQVLPFLLFAIYIFELLNIGYFSIKDNSYFKGGMIAVTIQSVVIIFANVWYNHKKKK